MCLYSVLLWFHYSKQTGGGLTQSTKLPYLGGLDTVVAVLHVTIMKLLLSGSKKNILL